jgi:UDP-2-acetamido-3-amino-2,3-dideoxy-glucuronate N-acetyltransferase
MNISTGSLPRIEAGASIGELCSIDESCYIESGVVIGNRVTVRYGVALWSGVTVEDDVVIGPNAAFTKDGVHASGAETLLKKGASIGANSTILSGVTVGERAVVHPAAFVTNDVPPLAIVEGNPARIVGYNGAHLKSSSQATTRPQAGVSRSQVGGVSIHRLPSAADMRGQLSFAEIGEHVPFAVRRFFLVYGVESKEVRGEHAHRHLHQFLICVHGQCSVMADDGNVREEFLLDDPTLALHLPPLVWSVQYKHSADAVLLVLASDHYDASDYIRDYSEFLRVLAGKRTA